jgi:hypothetical protein
VRFSLPYRRHLRHLSGIDWVMAGLHYQARKTTGTGSYSQAVLVLDGVPDTAILRSALDAISARLPLVHGWIKRELINLAPYWKIPKPNRRSSIPLIVADTATEAGAHRLLDAHVNTPLPSEKHHLSFLLVRVDEGRSYLGMVFDHRLLDAIGAESFLRLVDLTSAGGLEEVASKVKLVEPPHLDQWEKQFTAGKTVMRNMKAIGQREVCALAMPPDPDLGSVRFVHESLTADETAAFLETASSECGGMPILLPSAAARAVYAMRAAIPHPALPGTQHTLFTTASMRTSSTDWEHLFFNRFSFLLLAIGTEVEQSIPALAIAARDAFFEQMRDAIPQALADAAALSRVSPLAVNSWYNGRMFKGRVCSIYFACLREGGYKSDSFLGVPVANLSHKPLAFAPPGLNLCMTTHNGRFNLVLSYLSGVLNDATATTLIRTFKAALVGR